MIRTASFVESSAISRQPLASIQHFAWRYPEWWSLALSVLAWLWILASTHPVGAGLVHIHDRGGDGPSILPAFARILVSRWRADTVNWMLMVVAMMVPLVAASVHTAATRSLWRRRHRAIAGFLVGYSSPWLGLGLLVPVLLAVFEVWSPRPTSVLLSVGFATAAIWQLTPAKQHALRACHRTTPLAPLGWRADLDCIRYGWLVGTQCMVSCWALMLVCVLAPHDAGLMLCAALVAIAERYIVRLDPRVVSGVLSALAVFHASGLVRRYGF